MSRSAGFTILEAVVSAGLLIVVSLGTAQLFALAIAHNAVARQQLVMSVLAAAKVDELSVAIATGPITGVPPDALDRNVPGWSDAIVEAGRTYVRRWRIAAIAGYGTDAYAITIAVRPAQGPGGEVRTLTIRAAGT